MEYHEQIQRQHDFVDEMMKVSCSDIAYCACSECPLHKTDCHMMCKSLYVMFKTWEEEKFFRGLGNGPR